MAQAKLTDEVKTFIVQGLACFDSPSVVAKAVKDEFGEVITYAAAGYRDGGWWRTPVICPWRTWA